MANVRAKFSVSLLLLTLLPIGMAESSAAATRTCFGQTVPEIPISSIATTDRGSPVKFSNRSAFYVGSTGPDWLHVEATGPICVETYAGDDVVAVNVSAQLDASVNIRAGQGADAILTHLRTKDVQHIVQGGEGPDQISVYSLVAPTTSGIVPVIYGGGGHDNLDVAGGEVTVSGDLGNDRIKFSATVVGTNPKVDGGGGDDLLYAYAALPNTTVTLSGGDNYDRCRSNSDVRAVIMCEESNYDLLAEPLGARAYQTGVVEICLLSNTCRPRTFQHLN